jgi:protein-S-isoprenylcysteine O-methyltransferase Ste14
MKLIVARPVTDGLVITGPYRFVRHPLYLAMLVATIGLAVAFKSLWGMIITLSGFFPVLPCQARRRGPGAEIRRRMEGLYEANPL